MRNHLRAGAWVPCAVVGLTLAASAPPAKGQQIIPNTSNTQTTLQIVGNTTNVSTNSITGGNGFNSFNKFDVNAGNIVNLMVPTASQNLINVVNSTSSSTINGALNGIQNGQVGGSVFLVNPVGAVVGLTGGINTGSLSLITPTTDFVNGFFVTGTPDPAHVSALLAGTAPINSSGAVVVDGPINVSNDIMIQAGHVRLSDHVIYQNPSEISNLLNIDSVSLDIRGAALDLDSLRVQTDLFEADAGSQIMLRGDFRNAAVNMPIGQWNTESAELALTAGDHTMWLVGADLGSGGDNGYGWGTLSLASGASLTMQDSDGLPSGALYLGALDLGDGVDQLRNIVSNGIMVYYDPALAANAYLGGRRYELAGGGALVPTTPVPEPAGRTLLILSSLALAAVILGTRRMRGDIRTSCPG